MKNKKSTIKMLPVYIIWNMLSRFPSEIFEAREIRLEKEEEKKKKQQKLTTNQFRKVI